MKKEIRLEELWAGNGYRKLWVTAWNGEFGGAADIFVPVSGLAKIAESLSGFPSGSADKRTIQLGGEFTPSYADGAAELKFFCVDSAGHIEVQLTIESAQQGGQTRQRVSLGSSVDASDLAKFATELRVLGKRTEFASLRINRTRPIEATGENGEYQWLFSKHLDLSDLMRSCPRAVVGKFLAVTSFDSGSFVPNEEELKTGWKAREGIAYSPRVENAESLPSGGYDEWYLFDTPFEFGPLAPTGQNPFDPHSEPREIHPFVNFGGFALDDSDSEVTKLFWKQITRLEPKLYIACGDFLNVVCSDAELFGQILRSLRRLRPS